MIQAEPVILSRACRIFDEQVIDRRRRACRFFAWLLIVQWLAAIIAVLTIAPYSWIGERRQINSHVWIAIIFGGVLTLVPLYLIARASERRTTAHVIAVAQMLYSALLIHMTGGRIETHFHIFGSLAFLAIFRDWTLLITASVVVALDHFIRGVFVPLSVFGVAQPSSYRWVEHTAWVVFEDIVLITFGVMGSRELRASALDRARIELSRDLVEAEVRERTRELTLTAEALRDSERQTRAAMDAAEAASHAKSQFLANMSHEIRTPMTAIIGYADLLELEHTPPERAELLSVIKSNGEHLLLIINDILDLSKIEAGHMSVESVRTDVPQIIAQVGALLRGRAIARDIKLEITCQDNIPPILSDPLRIRQILVNLLSNAIKFTEHGSVHVCVGVSRREEDHVVIEFVVRDTGIGMDAPTVASLFRPFVQADNSMSRRFGGTGLGLFISRRLAEMLGGSLTVTSTPGEGSTFTLAIRVRCAGQAELRSSDAGDAPFVPSSLDGSILLAEDGRDNQRLFATHLGRAGARVTIVGDGDAAVEAAMASLGAGAPFDLILMDMQMPRTDGYAATKALRHCGWTGPIIAITAHAMPGDRERCIDAGCNDYLTKPIERRRLFQTCARYLKLPASPPSTPSRPSQATTSEPAQLPAAPIDRAA